MPVIGLLSVRSPATDAPLITVIRRNVAIDYRWAYNNNDRLPELAADLVRCPRYPLTDPR